VNGALTRFRKIKIDRLRFYIDSDNSPKIEVLDEKGEIIKNILE